MRRNRGLNWLVVVLAVLAMVAAACGSDNNATSSSDNGGGSKTTEAASKVECATGTLSGAGATFPQTIISQWIKDFGAACSGATVNYQPVGSGAGIQQFTAKTVDFGASDAVMKPEEQSAADAAWGAPTLHIPWTSGGIAVEYNLPSVKNLKLSAETVAGIFAGKITKWNDPKIKADNSGATLPSTGIQVVHRSDGSGTTNAFTSYLTAAAPSVWTAGSGKDVPWPTGQGAKGSDGVTAAVKQAEGAIGYAEVSFAQANSLGVALIKNTSGEFVGPTPDAVSAALASAEVPTDLKVKVNYTPDDPKAYPISTTTWVLVPSKVTDAAKAKLLKSFLTYVLGPGQDSAADLYYAPLPKDLLQKATAAVESVQSPA